MNELGSSILAPAMAGSSILRLQVVVVFSAGAVRASRTSHRPAYLTIAPISLVSIRECHVSAYLSNGATAPERRGYGLRQPSLAAVTEPVISTKPRTRFATIGIGSSTNLCPYPEHLTPADGLRNASSGHLSRSHALSDTWQLLLTSRCISP